VAREPKLIIQVPRGGAVDRQLAAAAPQSITDGEVVVVAGPTDAAGHLEPPATGEIVMSVPSPEALAREADEVRHVIARAGTGVEPLVVVVEAAEELRDDELAAVLDAAEHPSRAVILRVMRDG
jgi:hypothetical protein